MRDVLDSLMSYWRDGTPVALASVVATYKSAPREAGAAMLVGPHGEAVGSVSRGCVEGAVYELGSQVIKDGGTMPPRDGLPPRAPFAGRLSRRRHPGLFLQR